MTKRGKNQRIPGQLGGAGGEAGGRGRIVLRWMLVCVSPGTRPVMDTVRLGLVVNTLASDSHVSQGQLKAE